MILIERIKTNFEHTDERGKLIQLVRRGYSQINIVFSKAGVFRGGHYHKLNTEAYYVIAGKCQVTAKKGSDSEIQTFSQGDFFRISPYVIHDFNYIEDTVLVTMYSLGVELNCDDLDCDEKDIYVEKS